MAKMIPELRAAQRIIEILEPFTDGECERIVCIACALLGRSWTSAIIPRGRHRKVIQQARAALKVS